MKKGMDKQAYEKGIDRQAHEQAMVKDSSGTKAGQHTDRLMKKAMDKQAREKRRTETTDCQRLTRDA